MLMPYKNNNKLKKKYYMIIINNKTNSLCMKIKNVFFEYFHHLWQLIFCNRHLQLHCRLLVHTSTEHFS